MVKFFNFFARSLTKLCSINDKLTFSSICLSFAHPSNSKCSNVISPKAMSGSVSISVLDKTNLLKCLSEGNSFSLNVDNISLKSNDWFDPQWSKSWPKTRHGGRHCQLVFALDVHMTSSRPDRTRPLSSNIHLLLQSHDIRFSPFVFFDE